jgi:hypothetical protein
MLKKSTFLKVSALLVLGASAGTANAAFINGSISASGGLTNLGTTTYVTSQLNVLQDGAGTGVANTGTGSYSGIANGTAALLQPLDISSIFAMNGSTIFQIGGFTFIGAEIFQGPLRNALSGVAGNLSDSVNLKFIGTVKEAGFQDSNFLADFTANGNCLGSPGATSGPCVSNITGSWSVSISSNGQPPPALPEPATLSLLGIGLAAITAKRRRKSAVTLLA